MKDEELKKMRKNRTRRRMRIRDFLFKEKEYGEIGG